jgi:cytochrome c oxidase cbb3-type subunit 4
MTYEQVASISQVAALLFFIALFAAVVVYAFWPGNKKKFEEAAQLPLESDPEPEPERQNKKDD